MCDGQPIRCLLGVAMLISMTGAVLAREVTVKLKGGGEVVGELVDQTDTALRVRLKTGAERRIPRDQIEKIDERFSLEEEYRQRRSKINDTDFNARFELARWLSKIDDPGQQRQAMELAIAELDDLLKLKRDQEALFLRQTVANKLQRLQGPPDRPAPPRPEPAPAGDDAAEPPPGEGPPLLSDEQINRMKVFEVELRSRPPVVIPPKVVEEFLSKYLRDPVDPVMRPYLGREGERRFKSLEGHRQLEVMFDVKAREFYDRVQVREEPASLREFRMNINRSYVIRYCGQCHGQGKAAGYYVVMARPGQEQTGYTNLMIAASVQVGGLPMLMKDEPERSPLFQMGLPTKDAATPHPDVPGWKPYFARGRNDDKFRAMVAWLQSLYTDPQQMLPEYQPFGQPAEVDAEPAP